MNRFVVFTVVTGGYDTVLQPQVIDKKFDYILFSNDYCEQNIGIWEVRKIPEVVKADNKRLSRYPKTHPETLLSEYSASLYIDANIQIKDQWVYDRFLELYEKGIEYAGIKLLMTGCDCIYDHTFDMCQFLLEHESVAISQCHELYKRGFPRNYGLNENNVIFRIHTYRMKEADENWWWWITNYSFRDQFSLMYCLWKYGVKNYYYLPEGEDTRNSIHFDLIKHDGNPNVIKRKIIKRGLIEKLRVKCKSLDKDQHRKKWHRIYVSPLYKPYLYMDGIFTIIRNVPSLLNILIK